jgi:uncharacterized protein
MSLKLTLATSFFLVVPTVGFSQPQTIGNIPLAEESVGASVAYEQANAILKGPLAEKDLSKARQLLQIAADQGDPKAKGALGCMLAEGAGGPKDDALALEYFSQAAKAGQVESLYNQGAFLLRGRGAPRDLASALECLSAAAEAGSVHAQVKLADIYYFGVEGIEKDHARALPHLKRATAAGDAWACNILGIMAEYGYSMPRDSTAALHWFTVAANKGNAKAQGNLGRLLRFRKPTEENRLKAYVWLKLSSLQGDSLATYHLSHQRLSMSPAQIIQGDLEIEKFNEVHAQREKEMSADSLQNVR